MVCRHGGLRALAIATIVLPALLCALTGASGAEEPDDRGAEPGPGAEDAGSDVGQQPGSGPADAPAEEPPATASAVAPTVELATVKPPPPYAIGAYAEVFYQWNFNRPSNQITNYRGFDNRHNTFTIANVALDAQWDVSNVVGRVTLQVGHTPSTYYLAEPLRAGSSGANATGPELWKYVQQAYVGYRFGLGRGLVLMGGVFLSPIGPESIPIRDSWNWSRSNLFFGLPFYHTGGKATYTLTDTWAITVGVFNGWNSVVDNNGAKSAMVQAVYTRPDRLVVSLLYFTGVERPSGSPEGQPWRHLFDAHATWTVTPWLSLLAHANAGFEPNPFGVSYWLAGAGYARFKVHRLIYLAGRGDIFYEPLPSNAQGTAQSIFWPVSWVASGTATLEVRAQERISLRFEYRHDQAGGDLYFGESVAGDGSPADPFVPNRRSQDTVTVGATAWF